MEFNKLSLRAFAISAVVWATACSDVKFDQLPLESKADVPETEQKDSFDINDENPMTKVDVLFVVDNSISMNEEQRKLGNRLQSFISNIETPDWQIGLTTTDVSGGRFSTNGNLVTWKGTGEKILTKSIPNYINAFKKSVVREEALNCGTDCPSGDERALLAISMAVAKKETTNKGFFREGAHFATVILTDEDESDAFDKHPLAPEILTGLVHAALPQNKYTAFSISLIPGDKACFDEQSPTGQYSLFTHALSILTGGVSGSICDKDYGPTLADIGKNVSRELKTLKLRFEPIPDTVRVVSKPFDADLTWEVEGRMVRLKKHPARGTKLDVYYMVKK